VTKSRKRAVMKGRSGGGPKVQQDTEFVNRIVGEGSGGNGRGREFR
jgi:hypothetical protein